MSEYVLLRLVNCSSPLYESDSKQALIRIKPETAAEIREMAVACNAGGYHAVEKVLVDQPAFIDALWDDDVERFNEQAAAGNAAALDFARNAQSNSSTRINSCRVVVDGSKFWYRLHEEGDGDLETDATEIADLGPAPDRASVDESAPGS
ncbi:hypothetical protein FE249_18980 (plasmid) [Acidiphilium multivorum]|uniref:hypothetical protein n=1 Tax=Acidiphilium multivorum TaxID=62140 RepID=UPI001F4C365A|nr:hypothetical protein [Acidiphilium multivorum]UNC16296.1 hypothetical protein FE249_18980 [Acidiphilium multivorum]